MKGLLAKDIALMKQRGKILLFLLIWGIIMTVVMENSSFVVGWIVMIAVITSLSTISYDEYDNCMPFLMSLPVNRRIYAEEKYVFSTICGVAFWAVSLIIVAATNGISGKAAMHAEDFLGMVLFLAVVIQAFCIPPQLKWGPEKGRMAMLIIFGVVFVASILLSKFGDSLHKAADKLETLPMPGVVIGAVVASLIILGISVMISIRIMNQREF